ncbi:flagellar hook-length control protein FliK [Idiomarina seosinensis]|uniref:Flagellar hook-length control protein FliK n=1 Tax=Idiomarina seosinensis TaxID=281739 RepID=A0A432ZGL9_9GAMM|nr:flagellar hook-length control protein FliK [Idiomarina seosinensis]RUO77069.1 flagellar hook-length control protein FliK [Idiomarina seosinensis]
MELNQLLQQLLAQTGGKPGAGSNAPLTDLSKVVNAESAKTLMQVLTRAAGLPASSVQQAPPAQLPTLPVQLSITPAKPATQTPAQLTLTVVPPKAPTATAAKTNTQPVSIQIPVTKQQLSQLQTLLPATSGPTTISPKTTQQPMVLVVQPSPKQSPQQSITLQLINPKAPQKPVTIELPTSQLSKPLAQAAIASTKPTVPPLATPTETRQRPAPPQSSSQPIAAGVIQKQAQQITPQQFRQVIQQVVRGELQLTSPTAPSQPQNPQQAISRVLQAVMQQLPAAESMQQPQALKQWVNDWFAAKPVTSTSAQQMGNLGKMLMMLLGFAMQQPKANAAATTTTPLSAQQQNTVGQLTQALLDQVLRPAPRLAGEQAFSGEVRERINQLLQQLPATQLQRLMQLFTASVNSAQTSQARLADSAGTQPEYFVLLPGSQQNPNQQHELLIRREHERSKDDESSRTVWLFTLRFELQEHGPLLVKGRYHPAGTRVDFYTESDSAERAVQQQMEKLETRFAELEVNGLNLTVQKGKVPDTLAKQQSGIIRVTV